MRNIERRGYEVEIEPKSAELRFGIAVSNLGNPYNPENPIPENLYRLSRSISRSNQGIEIQPEGKFNLRREHYPTGEIPFLGYHMSIDGVDLLAEDETKNENSERIIKMGFRNAKRLNTDYVVTHLPSPKFNWEELPQREDNVEKVKSRIIDIAEIAKNENFKGKILIENLEFPQFPSTKAEIVKLNQYLDEIQKKTDIDLGFCIDLGHLWHSGKMLNETERRDEIDLEFDPFIEGATNYTSYLKSTLDEVGDKVGLFHIAGGEARKNENTLTHANPYISVNDNLSYEFDRLDIPGSLQVIHNFSESKKDPVNVINEAHGTSYKDMVHANQSFESFLDFAYPKHQKERKTIYNLNHFYSDKRVSKAIINFLGGEEEYWQEMNSNHSFIGVGHLDKLRSSSKSPISTTHPKYLGDWINSQNGNVEIYASLMHDSKENVDLPSRSLLVWDLDRYRMLPKEGDSHSTDDNTVMLTPYDTFAALDPVVNLYLEEFDRLGIPVMTTLSGKGIHFLSQIKDEQLLEQLKEIGGPVEDSLKGKLDIGHKITKARKPIPYSHQQIHVGAGRLQQFINMRLINKSRELLYPYFGAEVFSKAPPGEEANNISFDNSAVSWPVFMRTISTIGSPNLIKAIKTGVDPLPMSIQIPITGNGYRYNWKDVVHNREDLSAAANYLDSVDCHIPELNPNAKIFEEYDNSEIKKLHNAFDENMGDDPLSFDFGYRKDNYEGIVRLTKEKEYVRHIINNASEYFRADFNFYAFDKLIFQIFEGMGGSRENLTPAPHVAGVIRALFEDPHKNWGDEYTGKRDAATYARKMVEQILGQIYE